MISTVATTLVRGAGGAGRARAAQLLLLVLEAVPPLHEQTFQELQVSFDAMYFTALVDELLLLLHVGFLETLVRKLLPRLALVVSLAVVLALAFSSAELLPCVTLLLVSERAPVDLRRIRHSTMRTHAGPRIANGKDLLFTSASRLRLLHTGDIALAVEGRVGVVLLLPGLGSHTIHRVKSRHLSLM